MERGNTDEETLWGLYVEEHFGSVGLGVVSKSFFQRDWYKEEPPSASPQDLDSRIPESISGAACRINWQYNSYYGVRGRYFDPDRRRCHD